MHEKKTFFYIIGKLLVLSKIRKFYTNNTAENNEQKTVAFWNIAKNKKSEIV